MPNQYKPKGKQTHESWTVFFFSETKLFLAPLEDIRDALESYFHLGFNDKQLEEYLRDHYDTELYGLR